MNCRDKRFVKYIVVVSETLLRVAGTDCVCIAGYKAVLVILRRANERKIRYVVSSEYQLHPRGECNAAL